MNFFTMKCTCMHKNAGPTQNADKKSICACVVKDTLYESA